MCLTCFGSMRSACYVSAAYFQMTSCICHIIPSLRIPMHIYMGILCAYSCLYAFKPGCLYSLLQTAYTCISTHQSLLVDPSQWSAYVIFVSTHRNRKQILDAGMPDRLLLVLQESFSSQKCLNECYNREACVQAKRPKSALINKLYRVVQCLFTRCRPRLYVQSHDRPNTLHVGLLIAQKSRKAKLNCQTHGILHISVYICLPSPVVHLHSTNCSCSPLRGITSALRTKAN